MRPEEIADARLAGTRGRARAARRRDHEPELRRGRRRRALRPADRRQGHRAARHRPRASSTRRRASPPRSASGPRSSRSSSRRGTSSRGTSGAARRRRGGQPAGDSALRGTDAAARPRRPAHPRPVRRLSGRRGLLLHGRGARRARARRRTRDALALAHAIERARGAQPLRPCHNDLLNANLIDDGERIWIVDWEYAGMGDVFFDLANFSVNHEFGETENRALLDAYFGAVRTSDLASLRLMRFMSDFREAMWGVVQQAVSELDFDFEGYARDHFARLERTAADPTFREALEHRVRGAVHVAREGARARSVVIGGGVGGCSILYWLTQLGWRDVVLVERADLTSGSTFHSAGPRRPAAWLAVAHEDDDDVGRAVSTSRQGGRPRDGLARGRLAPARVVGGADGGAPPPGRLGEDLRPSARARLGRRGAAAVPPDVHGGCPRRRVPPHRRLHRPEPAHLRPGRRGQTRWCRHLRQAPASPASRSSAAAYAPSRPTVARSRRRSSSTPAGCSRARSGGSPASTCR